MKTPNTGGPADNLEAKTLWALLKGSKRPGDLVPIRTTFVQQGAKGAPRPGPLADLVHRHDEVAFDLLLLALASASQDPFDVRRPASVWKRSLHMDGAGALSTISKAWRRLEERRLILRTRNKGLAQVFLLKEDGSGEKYVHPFNDSPRARYLRLPFAYWLKDWQQELSFPAKAMLLIASSLSPGFWLPGDKAAEWYAISADTAETGFAELDRRGILVRRRQRELTPLSATGFTFRVRCTLNPPFVHRKKQRTAVDEETT